MSKPKPKAQREKAEASGKNTPETRPLIGFGSHGRKRPPNWNGGRPTAAEAEKRRTARLMIAKAIEAIGAEAFDAFLTLQKAHRGELEGSDAMTRQRAADSLLKKAGIGDTSVTEFRGPPVVVQLGGMPRYPKPDADGDGIEREEEPA